ncbi:hypothetical protein [Candidatus Amarolinea dominans]|uniref:hypothetical protein n=1 Tax=Candidatus Amarolinea dominans TaxID=3140696 RepID=UPI0031CC84DC
MDQYISSLGQAGHALLIDCRSLGFEAVPLPAGVQFVIADSTVRRGLWTAPTMSAAPSVKKARGAWARRRCVMSAWPEFERRAGVA